MNCIICGNSAMETVCPKCMKKLFPNMACNDAVADLEKQAKIMKIILCEISEFNRKWEREL